MFFFFQYCVCYAYCCDLVHKLKKIVGSVVTCWERANFLALVGGV